MQLLDYGFGKSASGLGVNFIRAGGGIHRSNRGKWRVVTAAESAGERSRTSTGKKSHRNLNPARLPVPPHPQSRWQSYRSPIRPSRGRQSKRWPSRGLRSRWHAGAKGDLPLSCPAKSFKSGAAVFFHLFGRFPIRDLTAH